MKTLTISLPIDAEVDMAVEITVRIVLDPEREAKSEAVAFSVPSEEVTRPLGMLSLRDIASRIVNSSPTLPLQFRDEAALCDWLNSHPHEWGGTVEDAMRRPWTYAESPYFGDRDIYETILCTERVHTAGHIDELTRYFFEGEFAGEHLGTEECYGSKGRLFILDTDFTKSRRDDWGDVLPRLWNIMREGSPVRKTNQAGPGTKGTRKVEGVDGKFWLAFR
jgi:hypothetical protein